MDNPNVECHMTVAKRRGGTYCFKVTVFKSGERGTYNRTRLGLQLCLKTKGEKTIVVTLCKKSDEKEPSRYVTLI